MHHRLRVSMAAWLGPAWLALGLMTGILMPAGCQAPHRFNATLFDPPRAAPDIRGTNWDGSSFALSELKGQVALVFFGYTSCPDVCPLTLAEMREIYKGLGDSASELAVVFVTVDPDRDTPARLAEYIPVFDRRFFGVFAEPDALEPIKAAYGVIAEKRYYDAQDSASGYSVDHTARTYVIDRGGQLRASFGFGTPTEDMLSDLKYLLTEHPSLGGK